MTLFFIIIISLYMQVHLEKCKNIATSESVSGS